MTKHVLLTGGLGFIGGHTVEHWLRNTDWDITVLDSLRFAGRTDRLTDIEAYDPDRVRVFWHDLRSEINPRLMYQIGDVDYIVNMASDSHVDRSITDPVPFVQNNVMLALNMLEYARTVEPEKYIQIGTDEIFGPAYGTDSHGEEAPLRPSNPYSASKAAQEQISFAYWRTYNVPVMLTRTMNNFGERQNSEKYLPMVVRNVLEGVPVTVHAGKDRNGSWEPGSRVWLHARNHADALMFLLEKEFPNYYDDEPSMIISPNHPAWFNIAGEREVSNLDIPMMVGDILGKTPLIEYTDYHSSRPGHDLRYSLNGDYIRSRGWVPPMSFNESFEKTVRWYADNPKWLTNG